MTNLAVILNGPPGCGKDTIANLIVERCNSLNQVIKHQFKDALYEHTAKHYQVDLDKFIHFASDRELKDSVSLAGLHGKTPRQALIHVSEDICKPRYGNGYFGSVEANRIRELKGRVRGPVNVIYPDGGFGDEVLAIESEFDCVLIVRLHRDGYDFTGDSRNYLNLPNTKTRWSVDEHLLNNKIFDGVWKVENWMDRIKWSIENELHHPSC